uniref:Uncharacterized protein n=1 Tax=Ditylenchus dipsaci TaxID=166011 RepID=A0A915EAM5_9BILA
MNLLREGFKLGYTISGKNASKFDDKNLKIVSPRFLSVVPENEDNKDNELDFLSPSLFSLHNQGKGLENLTSLPSLVKGFSSKDQQAWLDLIMEAAGVVEEAEKIEEHFYNNQTSTEVSKSKDFVTRYKKESVGKDGTSLYFTKENVTEMYGNFEERKIDLFEKLCQNFSKDQVKEMNKTGFAMLSPKQLEMLYGSESPYNNSKALKQFSQLNNSVIHQHIEDEVSRTAEMKSFKIRLKQSSYTRPHCIRSTGFVSIVVCACDFVTKSTFTADFNAYGICAFHFVTSGAPPCYFITRGIRSCNTDTFGLITFHSVSPSPYTDYSVAIRIISIYSESSSPFTYNIVPFCSKSFCFLWLIVFESAIPDSFKIKIMAQESEVQTVPMKTEQGIQLMQHWTEQAVGSLIAAVANKNWQETISKLQKSALKKEALQLSMQPKTTREFESMLVKNLRKHESMNLKSFDEFTAKMPVLPTEKPRKMPDQRPRKIVNLLRDGFKLAWSLSGKNASEFSNKTVKAFSPRFFSILPEEENEKGDLVEILSPSLLSLHKEGKGIEKLTSLPSLINGFNNHDQQSWMNLIMEASGVTEQADKIDMLLNQTAESSLETFQKRYQDEARATDGTPLYFTKENVTKMYGRVEESKITVFERLNSNLSTDQIHELNKTGYALLTSFQLMMLYGPQSPYADSKSLEHFIALNHSYLEQTIENDIHRTAQLKSFKMRLRRQTPSSVLGSISFVMLTTAEPSHASTPALNDYGGKVQNVPMQAEHGLMMVQHWIDQAMGSFMSAMANNRLKTKAKHVALEFGDCSHNAKSVPEQARCLSKLLKDQITGKKYLNKTMKLKYLDSGRLRLYAPRNTSISRKGRAVKHSWVGGFRLDKNQQERKRSKRYIVNSRTDYQLKSPKDGRMTPLGSVAHMLMKAVLAAKNKTETKP